MVPIRPALLLLAALPVAAAADEPSPRVIVTGTATVYTPPDSAMVSYCVHGESATSDDALRVLVAKRAAIDAGLSRLAGATPAKGGEVAIREVRSRECNQYGPAQLSTGACAILGYAADLSLSFRTRAVKDAGTMAGLVGRLGGTNPRVASFALTDDAPVRRRATAAALTDARAKADAIAAGAGIRLGQVMSVSDGSFTNAAEDIVVTASRMPAAPAPPPPPPVSVEVTPRPIETQARVTVIYQIAP